MARKTKEATDIALTAAANFLKKLAALAERDKHFAAILTVWFNANLLNDSFRMSDDARVDLGQQIARVFRRPIHRARWTSLKIGHQSKGKIEGLMLSSIFVAAGILKQEQDPPPALEQIIGDYKIMQRAIANLVTDDLAGPGWRKKKKETEYTETPDLSIAERLQRESAFRNRENLREFIVQRLASLSRKTPQQIDDLIEQRPPANLSELAKVLAVPRLDLYRKVIDPARKTRKSKN